MKSVSDMGRDGPQTVITTGSTIRAWWLTKFKGYEVSARTAEPKLGLLGRVKYLKHWRLKVSQDQEDGKRSRGE